MSICLLAATTFVLFLSTQVGTPVLPALSAQLGSNPQAMADMSTAMGAFDSAIDLVIFVAPLLGIGAYGIVRDVNPLILAAGLPALAALPVALRTAETRPGRGWKNVPAQS